MIQRLSFLLIITALTSPLWSNPYTTHKREDGALVSYAPNQVVVGYTHKKTKKNRASIASRFQTKALHTHETLRSEVLPVPAGYTVDSFINELKNDSNVAFAEPNYVYSTNLTPNDPQFSAQYSLQSGLLNMEQAWDISTGNASIVVAVVDSGLALTHPDIVDNLWINPAPSGTSGLNGTATFIDFDGNGDCLGTYDQCASNDPSDNHGHGTLVSGIIAARTNNGVDMAGVSHASKIMAVKAMTNVNGLGRGTASSITDGIEYAINNNADIINLSLGAEGLVSDLMERAIERALSLNIVVVAAAGNTDTSIGQTACTINFPGTIDGVITVGATDSNDQIANFSCTGKEIDLVAPGVTILSLSAFPPTGTTTNSGTSFAAPMVSGVAALLLSVNPNMPVRDVARYLDFYADDLGPAGFDNTYGFGRLNAYKTLEQGSLGTPFIANPSEPSETFPYPNPFNPTVNPYVTIAVPQSLGQSGLQIQIFSTAGERVVTLTGTNNWNGRNESGNTVASGLYFYYLKTDKGDKSGKLTVMK